MHCVVPHPIPTPKGSFLVCPPPLRKSSLASHFRFVSFLELPMTFLGGGGGGVNKAQSVMYTNVSEYADFSI